MKPEGSVPLSQQPYPDPDEYSPRPSILFLKIYSNIILPSRLRSFKWSFVRFLYQNFVCTSPLSVTCYLPHPGLLSGLLSGFPTKILYALILSLLGVTCLTQVFQLVFCQVSLPKFCMHFSSLR